MYEYNGIEYKTKSDFLYARRCDYFRLVSDGISSSKACRIVGVNKRTGQVWRNGRSWSTGKIELPYTKRHTDYMTTYMMTEKVYDPHFLSIKDRLDISDYLLRGYSIRAIAKLIDRSPSTISREVRKRSDRFGEYFPHNAHALSRQNFARPKVAKIHKYPELFMFIKEKLKLHWSPEQISREWNKLCDTECMKISGESIYQAIYVQAKGELKLEVKKALRTGRTKRSVRGSKITKSRFREPMINISERPPEVEDRAIPGHWEGDLILGAGNKSAIGTVVERSTRYALLLHLPYGHSAKEVQQAIVERFKDIPEGMRKSLTWDQGSELAHHKKIVDATNMAVYFCDPHSPWQRGTNENTNRLFRDWFPKGTNLRVHSKEYLRQVERDLNQRPRKTLGWETPEQRFQNITSVLNC